MRAPLGSTLEDSMSFSIVAADVRSNGDVVAVSTNKSENRIYEFQKDCWSLSVSWKGKEVYACCAVGDEIICPTVTNSVYLCRDSQVQEIKLPKEFTLISGACYLGARQGLVAGHKGRFAIIDVETSEAQPKSLFDYDVSKAGRTIQRVFHTSQGIYFLGVRNLLLRYDIAEDYFEDIGKSVFRGKEIFLEHLVEGTGGIWCSASEGPVQKLIKISNGECHWFESPIQGTSTPVLKIHKDHLFLGSSKVVQGQPDNWRDEMEVKDDSVIAFGETNDAKLCALTYCGMSYLLDGDKWISMPIF